MESHNGYRAKERLKMFCSRCGNQMEMNARFCTRCGFELEIAIPQQKNQLSVVQEPIVAHPEVDRKSCNSVKRVKMVVAIIAGITSYFVGSIFASNLHSYLNTKGATIDAVNVVIGAIGYIVVISGAALVLFGVNGLIVTSNYPSKAMEKK